MKNEDLRIKIDYNNMLTSAVGENGIEEEKLLAMKGELFSALERVNSKRDKLRWRELYITERKNIDRINETAAWVRESAEYFVVLGIGGSALGPAAVHQALRHQHYNELPREKRNGPKFYVEDNVDPERMAALLDIIDLDKTVFNVITKSGSTSETMSQLLIVTRLLLDRYGEEGLKDHIIATTDSSKGNLIGIAEKYNLRTFIVPDGVGGRFSELCPVGLVAAAVCGADIGKLLDGAEFMDGLCSNEDVLKNPALVSAALEVLAMEKGANISVLMPYADSLKYMGIGMLSSGQNPSARKRPLTASLCAWVRPPSKRSASPISIRRYSSIPMVPSIRPSPLSVSRSTGRNMLFLMPMTISRMSHSSRGIR